MESESRHEKRIYGEELKKKVVFFFPSKVSEKDDGFDSVKKSKHSFGSFFYLLYSLYNYKTTLLPIRSRAFLRSLLPLYISLIGCTNSLLEGTVQLYEYYYEI